jgi:hypothetical protein
MRRLPEQLAVRQPPALNSAMTAEGENRRNQLLVAVLSHCCNNTAISNTQTGES